MKLTTEEITYPSSDDQPMADSTIQYQWITTIKGGCDALFKNDPNVFVAGDLLWYPVEGNNRICQAPDTMVVFGRPKDDRRSYLQWKENNIPPQVVFEIRSYSDSQTKMAKKLVFYNRYGVEEYYLYDPDDKELTGWHRVEGLLEVIEPMSGWVSPRLNVHFELTEEGLALYRPDGQKFLSYLELEQQREQEAQRAERLAAKLRELNIDPDSL
ncbi:MULTISPECIES: Uma2 family endonuclease [unclassified Coleofasciculus]|uniref:Uma2 family endonuclease n=1 Tax=unclassified Coleofasciculus TaxID=2692782 RepID=UPI00188190B6|nr:MULTISPECIES: Uma2 family endonuclease [unclassified Coleofasciculus]MBE9128380.1 Uma2 family endonuclease [Coleofasciculus sp. LEGE 07081]MBE9147900.1 Uma2 family endonuclease [Coleofasciculus sp. LEGE 07092]